MKRTEFARMLGLSAAAWAAPVFRAKERSLAPWRVGADRPVR